MFDGCDVSNVNFEKVMLDFKGSHRKHHFLKT